MSVWVAGASHRTAPIEIRERLHVAEADRDDVLRRLLEDEQVREGTVLSTCNRSEVYLRLADDADLEGRAAELFARHGGLSAERVRSHLYAVKGREAAAHLFRVTSGLDSMVVGEPQIQGQVAAAYQGARAADVDAVGPVLHRLFQTALAAAGEVRAETAVGEGAASVPAAAVRLATKVFDDLDGRRAVVIGAGEMGVLTLSALLDRGVDDAAVASRTVDRAAEAAGRTGARAVAYDDVWGLLDRADVLVTSTSAPHPVVTAERMEELRRGEREPVVVIDIAVPRDVEPAVADLPNVFLYNIDDLQRVVETTERNRNREKSAAETLLEDRVEDFWGWYRAREAVPLIRGLRDRAESIREREMSEALSELDGLSEEERLRIHRASRLVLKKVLHAPTVGLRDLATAEEGDRLLELASRLFDVDRKREGAPAGEEAGEDGPDDHDASGGEEETDDEDADPGTEEPSVTDGRTRG